MVKNPCLHSTIIVSELVTLCLELTHRIIHLLVGLYQLYTKVDRAVLEIQCPRWRCILWVSGEKSMFALNYHRFRVGHPMFGVDASDHTPTSRIVSTLYEG